MRPPNKSKTQGLEWFDFLQQMFHRNEYTKKSDEFLMRFIMSEWEGTDKLKSAKLILPETGFPIKFLLLNGMLIPDSGNHAQHAEALRKLSQFRSYYNNNRLRVGVETILFSFRYMTNAAGRIWAVRGGSTRPLSSHEMYDIVSKSRIKEDPRVAGELWVDANDLNLREESSKYDHIKVAPSKPPKIPR